MATYTPISSLTLSANTTVVTLDNLPQGYTDLRVVMTPASSSGTNGIRMRMNGDSGANYSIVYMSGNGTLHRSATETSAVNISLNGYFGIETSTSFTQIYQLDLLSYSNSTTFKTVLARIGGGNSATEFNQGTWRATEPITSVSFNISTFGSSTGDFITGSRFDLYGIKAGTPKAQGGEIISTDGTYWYHTFNSSGIFTVQSSSLTVDYLVLGGGATASGGGSSGSGGGGGGGGSSLVTSAPLTSRDYTVIVGAGSPNGPYGSVGNNSTFNSTTGGGGQTQASFSVAAAGGTGTTQNGGAGGIGYNSGNAQNGGAGYASSISGSSVTRGGGGGGSTKSGTQGTGTNGGGNGVGSGTGGRGTANTGGGGGGSAQDNVGWGGGGGSGVVIVRYAV